MLGDVGQGGGRRTWQGIRVVVWVGNQVAKVPREDEGWMKPQWEQLAESSLG